MLTTCAAFTACTNEVENISQESRAALQLNVGVNQPTSRAIVEGKALPNDSQIGVSVVDNTGTAYQNQNYNNVIYTAAEEDGKQVWNTTANVTLSGEEATLYAYYPYAAGADITAIPVDMTETDQKDWMYATPVTGLSDGKSTAEVQLNHALTDLRLTFYKDTYSGAGEVTEFTIQSTGMAVGGTLNAKTGEITLPATPVNTITRTAAFTLTDKASATPMDVMLIPTGTEAPITVSVTVDGHTYSASTTAFTLQKAKAYNYVMKLTSTGLEVTSVELTDWNEGLLDDATFEPEKPEDYTTWLQAVYTVTENTSATKILFIEADNVAEMKVLDNVGSRTAGEPVSVTPSKTYQFSKTGTHIVYIKFKDKTTIPNYAFENCTNMTEVKFGSAIENIGKNAFTGCTGLKELVIPHTVKTIGYESFSNCNGLISVTIGSGLQQLGYAAFYGTNEIRTLIFEGNSFELWSFNASMKNQGLIIVPDGCFNSVSSYKNWKIKEVSNCYLENGVYYSVDGKNVIHFDNYTDSYVNIKNGVETIEDNAFNSFTGELNITIPNSVKTIGSSAFENCNNLKLVTIGGAVESIEAAAFAGCNALTEISLPESVTEIGDNAFEKCSGLKGELVIPNSVTSIGEFAFNGCSSMEKVTISNKITTIKKGTFNGCTGLKSVTIPNSVTTIGMSAFYGCENITTLDLGEGVETIEESAFKGCTYLTCLVFPESTKSVGFETFCDCI